MKKIAKYFFAALAMASAVSCVKDLRDDFQPVDRVQGKSYVFTATMADTKAVLDEESLANLWMGDAEGNEYISVLEQENRTYAIPFGNYTYVASDVYEPTSSVEFAAENTQVGIVGNAVYAVYPKGDWTFYTPASESDATTGVVVDYATVQAPVAGTYDPKAPVAIAYNGNIEANQNLSFHNASALLKIQIAETSGTVKDIKVIALGGEKISGAIAVDIKNSEVVVVPTEAAKSYVDLASDSEFEKGATYYIAVAPATLESGVAIQFNNDEIQTYTVSREIDIEIGKVYDLGTFSCAEPEDEWYLIGDYNVGNVNTIKKTAFVEVDGQDLLVAKNVTIAELQGFKVYNPTVGTFYPEVKDLGVDEWFPLTEGVGYGYTLSTYNTYDVYVDYVDETMTGIILVEAGSAVPAFAQPEEALYTFCTEGDDPVNYYINIEADAITIGYNYDEEYAYRPDADPSMEGKWGVETKITDYTVTPTSALAGTITYTTEESWGTAYWMIKYSNCYRETVVFSSPDGDLGIPAEGGENYWGIGGVIETMVTNPNPEPGMEDVLINATWTVCDEEVNFAYPVPSGLFMYFDEMYENFYVLDLGSEDGYTFRQGQYMMPVIPDDAAEFYNFFGVNGNYCQVAFTGDIDEIIPTDNKSGEIHVKVKGQYYKAFYSEYTYNSTIKFVSSADINDPVLDEDGNQKESWDGETLYFWNGFGVETFGAMPLLQMLPAAPRYISYEVPAEMPSTYNTPEGNTYTYTDESYGYDIVVDFANVIEDAIVRAMNYDQAFEVVDGLPFEEMWWNPELEGMWVSQGEVYSDYTIIPTAEDAGVITFVAEVTNNWGDVNTQYFRIEYSDLTDDSVMLYSPSTFDNKPVYDTEDGEPVMTDWGSPCYWDGIGLANFDENYNSIPVEVTLSNETPVIYVEKQNRMTPDEAQWVIYDTTLATSFMLPECKLLLNIGAADYSSIVGAPGKYINFAWPVAVQGGPDGVYSYLQTSLLPNSEYELVAGVEVEEEWGTYEDPSAGYIVVKSPSAGEGIDAETESGELVIKYRNFNPYTGSCEFELSSLLPTQMGGGMELLSVDGDSAAAEAWFFAFITPTKELVM